MQTPAAKYFCPKCRSSFHKDSNFCGKCGADMRHASVLQHAKADGTRATAPRGTGAIENRRGVDPWLGRVVDDRYLVEEVIGRGGMGVVYKIKHQRMGKIAAMKVLHSELAADAEVVRRFQTEAEAVSRLAHPNTVQVFDFGQEDEALYLVMEYVKGQDLGTLIDRDGPMSFERAAPLLAQVLAALQEAHELGVIHRDLKPENILVTRTRSGHDFVKVLDFGLAKLSEREEAADVTSKGSIVGTPYYMSPEQIRAEEELDARADIYSFGALIYRLVTADNAFNANSPVGVLTKHLTDELEPPSKRYPGLELPPEVDNIVLRCMAKKRTDRYDNVLQLLEDIEKLHTSLLADRSDIRQPPTSLLSDSGRSPAPVAALLEEEVDYGIQDEMRLKRGDLDVFEKSLRRRHSLRLVTIPLLLLLAGAAAGYWLFLRPEPVYTSEREPNDELADATLIAGGEPVAGYVGQRMSKVAADRDYYRVQARPAPQGGDVVTVQVSSPPNVDVRLDIFDASGSRLASADEAGIGGGEAIRRLRVRKELVVSVSGVVDSAAGSLPVENVSDPYELKVLVSPEDARLESEPNDNATDANAIGPGSPVTGHLDHRGDVDVYRFDGQPGTYQLLISGGPEVPFEWKQGSSDSWQSKMKEKVELGAGETLHLRRRPESGDDEGVAAKVALQGSDAPYTIDLSP